MADPTPPDPFPGLDDLIADGAQLETLATDLRFIEGPVWIADQLIFSDIPANKLLTHSDAKGLGLLRQPSANANGNTVDPQGRLVSCLHGDRSVVRTELDGKITLLADRFHGKRFNSPNDVAIQRDGTIWFSDPTYGLGNARP